MPNAESPAFLSSSDPTIVPPLSRVLWPLAPWPTIHRTMNARRLTSIANDPAVRPFLGALGDGQLQLQGLFDEPSTVALESPAGGFIGLRQEPGHYDVHSIFLPDHGTAAILAMREALDYLFASTDAVHVSTLVPDNNPAADGLARLAGFHRFCRRQTALGPADVRTLHIDEWLARSAGVLACGTWIHETFDSVLASHASILPPHSAEDPMHLRAAGAAGLMLRTGNVSKAVGTYNRWANLMGYSPIIWLNEHPTILEMDGLRLELRGEVIEVLSCP